MIFRNHEPMITWNIVDFLENCFYIILSGSIKKTLHTLCKWQCLSKPHHQETPWQPKVHPQLDMIHTCQQCWNACSSSWWQPESKHITFVKNTSYVHLPFVHYEICLWFIQEVWDTCRPLSELLRYFTFRRDNRSTIKCIHDTQKAIL